jgi:hypothetical protein
MTKLYRLPEPRKERDFTLPDRKVTFATLVTGVIPYRGFTHTLEGAA